MVERDAERGGCGEDAEGAERAPGVKNCGAVRFTSVVAPRSHILRSQSRPTLRVPPLPLCFLCVLPLLSALAAAQSPFATQVIAYDPAPGQFVQNPQFNDPTRAVGPPIDSGTEVGVFTTSSSLSKTIVVAPGSVAPCAPGGLL